MNETIYNIMIYGGISLAVIFAGVAIILFIRLDIPKVIGDLTGRTAKKQIKEIQEKGYESIQGSGASKKEAIKEKTNSGKISVRDIKPSEESEASQKAKEKYQKAISEAEKIIAQSERETDVLSEGEDYERETDVLSGSEDYESETNVLSGEGDYEQETDVLSGEDYESETNVLASGFESLVDIVVVHTEESI